MINNSGLDITEEQFMKLSSAERDIMIFRNLVHIRKQFKDYDLTKKIQYVWLTILTAILLALLGIKGLII